MKRTQLVAVAAATLVATLAGSAQAQDKKTLAFVVNGASDFWKAAEAGVKKAQAESPGYSMVLKYPEQSSAAIQIRLMDDLVASGVAGIMVSAVDPKTSSDSLNRIGGQVVLFTTDSDAPNTSRVAYIGSSNVDAGKQAGELVLKAMPDGGKCMGFVGLLGADNAKERIDGVKQTIAGSKVSLVDVRGDDIDQTRAKRNVEDTLTADPDDQLHGRHLFLQHAADLQCAEGSREARPDHDHRLRRGSGDAWRRQGRHASVGTVVQQPYEWGYQGMKDMVEVSSKATSRSSPPAS